MDCSPPGSSLHGTLQTRILEWVAISFWSWTFWFLGIYTYNLAVLGLSCGMREPPPSLWHVGSGFQTRDQTCIGSRVLDAGPPELSAVFKSQIPFSTCNWSFVFSLSSWFSPERVCLFKNLSISSRLSILSKQLLIAVFWDVLYFCGVGYNFSFFTSYFTELAPLLWCVRSTGVWALMVLNLWPNWFHLLFS